ncbi:unnamed protein product [Sphagnum jensenii]|uniref:Uncharacterized protein n=1 Tax=Sphagnum jensenii TaxID=128206 RepID=A0ABP0WH97_9BRYO
MITMSCAWHSSSFLHRRRDFANSLDGKGDMASVRTDTAVAGDTKVVRGPCCETKRGGEEVTVSRSRGGREERKCCISRGTKYNNTMLKSSSSENFCGGPAEAARFARNDAMLVCAAAQNLDERARSDISLLSQEISRLDMRARAGVALLGSGFLMLDARAREDVEKLDVKARKKMARLRHIALGMKESARMELSSVAEEHWSDGALDADLRLADLRARRRAMEDLHISLEIVKNVHSALVSTLLLRANEEVTNAGRPMILGSVEEDNSNLRWIRQTVSNPRSDYLTVIEDAYWSMASALVEVEGKDCSDPDELEFIVAALLDLEEVDGGSGALLVAECARSPDVATRHALAEALANAPSLWTLGNAGMGALQRLAEDSNPTVAAAATKAICDLKLQWRQQDRNISCAPLDEDADGSSDIL